MAKRGNVILNVCFSDDDCCLIIETQETKFVTEVFEIVERGNVSPVQLSFVTFQLSMRCYSFISRAGTRHCFIKFT